MLIIGGASSLLGALVLISWIVGCLWPGTYFALFVGVWCILQGCNVLSQGPAQGNPPNVSAILLIVNIINGNLITLVLGIICLVFLVSHEVKSWYYPDGY